MAASPPQQPRSSDAINNLEIQVARADNTGRLTVRHIETIEALARAIEHGDPAPVLHPVPQVMPGPLGRILGPVWRWRLMVGHGYTLESGSVDGGRADAAGTADFRAAYYRGDSFLMSARNGPAAQGRWEDVEIDR